MATAINFNGSIPQAYEDYLTKFLFDGFGEDLVKRVPLSDETNVLELASGTGCVTRLLADNLPASAHLIASDLQPGMLEVAKKSITASNISWHTVDMTDIPFEENRFEVIVCQFGLMLVPDKLKAVQEMYRVLKPGGKLVFNVWGAISDNAIWNIGSNVLKSFLETSPIEQDPGPFALNETNTLQLLQDAGFINTRSSIVNLEGSITSAALAAKGFVEGLPVGLVINKSNPELVPKIRQSLEEELVRQLGDHPLTSPLQAIVFETSK